MFFCSVTSFCYSNIIISQYSSTLISILWTASIQHRMSSINISKYYFGIRTEQMLEFLKLIFLASKQGWLGPGRDDLPRDWSHLGHMNNGLLPRETPPHNTGLSSNHWNARGGFRCLSTFISGLVPVLSRGMHLALYLTLKIPGSIKYIFNISILNFDTGSVYKIIKQNRISCYFTAVICEMTVAPP